MVVIPGHIAVAVNSAPTFHYTPPGLATHLASAIERSIGNTSSEYLKLNLEEMNVMLRECLPLIKRILKYVETNFIYDYRFENLEVFNN